MSEYELGRYILPSLSSQYVYYPADQLTCLFNLKSIKFSILHNYGKLINLYVTDQIAVLLATGYVYPRSKK